jgi:hypothetical protein
MTERFRKGVIQGFSHFAGQEWPPSGQFWKDEAGPAAPFPEQHNFPRDGDLKQPEW